MKTGIEIGAVMAVHDRMKYARQRANLSLAQVKEKSGIGESSLSEFENGKREPSLSQLQKLANVYTRSVVFFLAGGPLEVPPTVLWRQRPKENAQEVEVQFLRLCEQYHNLEIWCGEPAVVSLPSATGNPATYGYAQAEDLARRVRCELQLGDRPGLSLMATLEEVCGVKIFHLNFEPSGTAAATVSDALGAAILLNSQNARWRRNHDLAHELFHLLTWPMFHPTAEAELIAREREEKLATCFAANLLLPADPFRSAINARMHHGKITIESLYDVAREFDVSVDSVLWRMHILYGHGQASADQTRRDIERARILAPLLEDRENQKPLYPWPARYHALAVKALRRGEIAIGRFAEYLDISRQEAMRFVEQEVPDGEEVQVAPA
jgi:Zn-dependent peptidase ImmA (M78 family)/transcriptional regulator with XRE-family HTH domain